MNKVIKSLCIILVVIMLFALTITCYAHSGRTDSNGGHRDSSTGQYHYHHGYPAHQHTGGVCPYDYDDKTSSDSGYNKSSSTSTKSSSNSSYTPSYTSSSSSSKPKDENRDIKMGFLCLVVLLAIVGILKLIQNGLSSKENKDWLGDIIVLFWYPIGFCVIALVFALIF